ISRAGCQVDGCAGSGGKRTRVSAVQKVERGVSRNAREVAALLVVAEEEERLVLYDWPAHCAAKLVTNVNRFESHGSKHTADVLRDEAARVARSPFVIALEVEQVAVKLV